MEKGKEGLMEEDDVERKRDVMDVYSERGRQRAIRSDTPVPIILPIHYPLSLLLLYIPPSLPLPPSALLRTPPFSLHFPPPQYATSPFSFTSSSSHLSTHPPPSPLFPFTPPPSTTPSRHLPLSLPSFSLAPNSLPIPLSLQPIHPPPSHSSPLLQSLQPPSPPSPPFLSSPTIPPLTSFNHPYAPSLSSLPLPTPFHSLFSFSIMSNPPSHRPSPPSPSLSPNPIFGAGGFTSSLQPDPSPHRISPLTSPPIPHLHTNPPSPAHLPSPHANSCGVAEAGKTTLSVVTCPNFPSPPRSLLPLCLSRLLPPRLLVFCLFASCLLASYLFAYCLLASRLLPPRFLPLASCLPVLPRLLVFCLLASYLLRLKLPPLAHLYHPLLLPPSRASPFKLILTSWVPPDVLNCLSPPPTSPLPASICPILVSCITRSPSFSCTSHLTSCLFVYLASLDFPVYLSFSDLLVLHGLLPPSSPAFSPPTSFPPPSRPPASCLLASCLLVSCLLVSCLLLLAFLVSSPSLPPSTPASSPPVLSSPRSFLASCLASLPRSRLCLLLGSC
ncbi:hypothetical protein C7M84_012459 [Penaeus vannamei]|uniref:Uncharacterized protein n=1 Tax=Penaeus vannamei TaxID=6689 RepID=A0A423SYF7_PENVA|nr:hypothetical protein C7M84_012459 [Penaeus vannamei]